MNQPQIHGKQHPLDEVFSDAFFLRVPPYQRPYSWTVEQTEALMDDLLAAFARHREDAPEPYFLGCVVLAKQEHQSDATVIDGQQRLTTLTLLLACLAHTLDEDFAQALRHRIVDAGDPVLGTEARPRLVLGSRDTDFLRKHVQEATSLDGLLSLDPGRLDTEAKQNIQQNVRTIREVIGKRSDDELRAFAGYLLTHIVLIVVSTRDERSAFRIFMIINDRGLDLTHADILKSEAVGALDWDEQESFTKRWEDAEQELGREQFAELFGHIRFICARKKQQRNILDEFRDHVLGETNNSRSLIDEIIEPYADVYADIINRTWWSPNAQEEISRWLTRLGRLDNVDWVAPAMRYLREHREDAERVRIFLMRLERLAASMFIRRVPATRRIARYGQLLEEIDSGLDISVEEGEFALSVWEQEETYQKLSNDLYLVPRIPAYVLLRLDEALSGGGATYDHSIITVEHVLPQHPAEDSEWVETFSVDQRERWTHRFANLVLLNRRKNSGARNYDFERKKQRYFTGPDGTSPFTITTGVLQHQEWTPEVLEQRQGDLLARLKELWDLSAVSSGHGSPMAAFD